MSEITLVRQAVEIPEADREAARRVLFGIVDGLGEINRKRWRRFFSTLLRMEPGEMATIRTHKARSGPFHRRHMAMEQAIFENQDRFENFEKGFRDWLKVGAGHCDWHPGPRGGIFPVPKSISYSEIEEGEMREFHEAAVAFLRTDHATRALWPHAPEDARMQAIEALLQEFGE
jgi:hypothetical protein